MKTEQEIFWMGSFGDEYTDRNANPSVSCALNLFSKILPKTNDVKSVYEIGANQGLNLDAISQLIPGVKCSGVEINGKAAAISKNKGYAVEHGSAFEVKANSKFDLVFTRGVLIHINPDKLEYIYDLIGDLSSKYILVDEYFSSTPVEVTYRGNTGKLFKRDFAKEIMDRLNLELVDYGFTWRWDSKFHIDDSNWFLFRKPT